MTVFVLQIIAMITMLSDHLGGTFFDSNVILRSIGRFAFPIYAFLVVEGYRHIKNNPEKMEKHLAGYIILAIISEFCYDLVEAEPFNVEGFASSQNCIITLLLGFLGLIAIDKWKDTNKLYMWSAIALTAMMNYLVHSNYKFAGVLLMYAFYFYLNRYEGKNYLWRFGVLLVIFACYIPIYHWARYDFCSWSQYVEHLIGDNTYWYLTHILIAGLLATYTGKKGYSSKPYKTFYRYFYPGHLLVLGIIKHLVF